MGDEARLDRVPVALETLMASDVLQDIGAACREGPLQGLTTPQHRPDEEIVMPACYATTVRNSSATTTCHRVHQTTLVQATTCHRVHQATLMQATCHRVHQATLMHATVCTRQH